MNVRERLRPAYWGRAREPLAANGLDRLAMTVPVGMTPLVNVLQRSGEVTTRPGHQHTQSRSKETICSAPRSYSGAFYTA